MYTFLREITFLLSWFIYNATVTKIFYPPTLMFFVLIQNCVCRYIELILWTKVSEPVIEWSCLFEVYYLSIMR